MILFVWGVLPEQPVSIMRHQEDEGDGDHHGVVGEESGDELMEEKVC